MVFYEARLTLEDGIVLTIVHNIEDPAEFEAAVHNWDARTEVYTEESFCEYINSKREKGLSDHYAFTEKQFKELEESANEHEDL